ncbi:DMT family transporter [Sediminibacterium roseum]|uniref:DMT family transporter n=1 Tax=Sediminibacterium roseum TaxID=1978412 RepID=A0ABW9ZZ96_9BACT|nr:DMT family transporter [Sediminibacterium roseum]NCI51574.1 DMT family transporter [Sediminibacterium roseum]
MRDKLFNWALFTILSLIWGSSFILMKAGMNTLTAYHVASIRILSAGVVLIPFAFRALKQVPKNKLVLVILSGLLGSFFPAYLFCIAETRIESSLAGILNALTPLFTILVGIAFFQLKANVQKIIGVLIGFGGLCLLVAPSGNISFEHFTHIMLVLLATLLYGINVNMVGRHMQGVGSINIAALAFTFLIVPTIVILYFTGYFHLPLTHKDVMLSTLASSVLGIGGTAIASILFYMLVKRAGTLFASMVTYGIPFVAVLWGVWGGEQVTLWQMGCLGIILAGVYLVNKKN